MLQYLEKFFKDHQKIDENDINELSDQNIMIATAAIFLEIYPRIGAKLRR